MCASSSAFLFYQIMPKENRMNERSYSADEMAVLRAILEPSPINSAIAPCPPPAKLTTKQKLFVEHYVATLNATQAANRAGYRGSVNTLSTVGYENLRKPEIAAEITRRLSEETIPMNLVMARLSRIARGTLEPFLYGSDSTGAQNPKASINLDTPEARANADLIKKVRVRKRQKAARSQPAANTNSECVEEVEIEIHDSLSALSKIAETYIMLHETMAVGTFCPHCKRRLR
jgi:hypothetical protein